MKHGKLLVRWLAVLLMIVSIVGVITVSAAETGIALEGKTIYLTESPTEVEQTAAEELQRYLYKMTGTKPAIKNNTSTLQAGIFIGETKKTVKAGITFPDAQGNGEGWTVQSDSKNVYLHGGSTRGVLYAVYHLLEDVLGVRWWNMWEEYVPSVDSAIMPANYSDSGEPVFSYRDIYTGGAESGGNNTLFFVRNRMNGFVSKAPVEYGDKITYTSPYHVHTFNRYFGESDFAANPEWFAEIDGVRVNDGQLCMSNDDLAAEYAQRILNNITYDYNAADAAGRARPKFADITPNDTGGFCECSACTASTKASGPSGHLLKFVNKVAAIVGETRPEITLATAAYWQYYDVPLDSTRPASNVMVRLASSDVDIVRNIDHPTNAKVKERLDKWAAILDEGQLYYWNYSVLYDRHYGVLPNVFKFQNDFAYFADKGGEGIFTEVQMNNTADFWEMNLWLMTKVTENPYQDISVLAQDFTNGYYGAAAGADIYAYLRYMEAAANSYNKGTTFSGSVIDAPWLDAADIVKGHQYFENAVAKTLADTTISDTDRELYLNRINVARSGLDRVIVKNYERFASEAVQMGLDFPDKQAAGRRVAASFAWRQNLEQDPDTVIDGINEMGNRYSTDSGSAWMLQRYAQYVGELEPDNTMWWSDLPQQIYDENPDVDPAHIYDFPATAFYLNNQTLIDKGFMGLVPGAGSTGGSALMWDMYWISQYWGSAKDAYKISTTIPLHTNADFKLYLNNPVVADGKYHLYHIEDTVIRSDGRPEIKFFDGTVGLTVEGLDHLEGKPVDLYLSMKIEGDPSTGNNAKIYIDRLVLVEDCTDHEIVTTSQSGATCNSNAYGVGPCPVCGKEVRAEVPNTKLPHKITGSYTYNASTRTYTASCSVCGTATYQVEREYPSELLTYLKNKGIGLEHIREFDTNDFSAVSYATYKSDSDSPVGQAVVVSSSNVSDLTLRSYAEGGESGAFGSPNKSTIKNNAGKGYKIYQLDGGTIPVGEVTYWHTFTWSLQSKVMARELQDLAGQAIGAYYSIKCVKTGGSSWNATYDYYMDRIFIVEPCGGCGAGSSKIAVRFNSNGGSYVAEKGVTSGSSVSAPNVPTRDGFVFAGWYLGDVKYDFSKAVTTPITLTAKWERNVNYVAQMNGTNYESLYDAVEAAEEGAVITLLADTTEIVVATVPMTVTRNGFTASGLYAASGLKMTAGGSAYSIWRVADVPTGLLAPLPAAVQADLDAAGVGLEHVHDYDINSFNAGASTTVDAASALGTAMVYNSGSTSAANRQSYFVFTEDKPFTLTHQMYSGEAEALSTVSASEMQSNSGNGDYCVYKLSGVVVPSNLHYLWGFDWTLQHKFADIAGHVTGQTVDLYISMKIEGNVSYDENNPSGGCPVYYIDRIIVVDYPSEYTVTFDNDGVLTTVQVAAGQPVAEPAAPTKDGFIFDGWYLDGEKYDFSKPVTGTITLTAVWVEDIPGYTITFVNDGTTTTTFVPEGELPEKPEDPVKDGYTFMGWYNGTTKYDFTDYIYADMTLVAKWTGTMPWTSGSLVLNALLNIRMKCVFVNFDELDTSVENEAIISNGGCLVWTDEKLPADPAKAVHGTQVYDLDLVADSLNTGKKYNGHYQYTADLPIWSWDYAATYHFRPYFVVDGEYVYGDIREYGVQQYASSKLGGSNETLKSVLVALLNYGSYAQEYFNKDTDTLANEIVDKYIAEHGLNASYADLDSSWNDDYLTATTPASDEMTANIQPVDPSNIKLASAALRLGEAIGIKYTATIGNNETLFNSITGTTFYFWSEPDYLEIQKAGGVLTKENATRVASGTELAYNANKSRYDSIGHSYSIFADRYGEAIYAAVCFTDNNGQEYWSKVMTYNVEQYASNKITTSNNEVLKTLCKWLVIYGERARVNNAQ